KSSCACASSIPVRSCDLYVTERRTLDSLVMRTMTMGSIPKFSCRRLTLPLCLHTILWLPSHRSVWMSCVVSHLFFFRPTLGRMHGKRSCASASRGDFDRRSCRKLHIG